MSSQGRWRFQRLADADAAQALQGPVADQPDGAGVKHRWSRIQEPSTGAVAANTTKNSQISPLITALAAVRTTRFYLAG
jgi:hypothetical protein